MASIVLPQHSSHGRLRRRRKCAEGFQVGGAVRGSSVANLDGPLAVDGRRVKAGVERGGEGSIAFREDATTGCS